MKHDTSRRNWLQLMAIPKVGETRIRQLIDTFGSPENVFQASAAQLSALPRMSETLANDILTYRDSKWIDQQLKLMDDYQVTMTTLWDAEYPAKLKMIFDPPPVLFIRGELRQEDDFAIGVVGTRQATHYGKQVTNKLCQEMALRGLTIISGLARGIDTVAHKATIAAKGRTVAVLGCGLDVVYPPENKKLYQEIEISGAIISEYPMKTTPEPGNFPGRNRLISGLSLGVLIVEAGQKSGALLTAEFAADQGREVFAIPGNIYSPASIGPNQLIRNGAKIVTEVEDIISELRALPQSISQRKGLDKKPAPQLSPDEIRVYEALSVEPKHIDALSEELGLATPILLAQLLQLELKGAVLQLPGKMFVVD